MLVVVRLAENGCLLHQLKKNREVPYVNVEKKNVYFSDIDKTRIARDVASGMLHLSNKKVKKHWSGFRALKNCVFESARVHIKFYSD